MNGRSPKTRGMTAIEVLAATVLASLMLASIVGLTGTLARHERVLRRGDYVPPWHAPLSGQLEWDLRNARRFSASRQGLRVEGFMGRDFASGRPTGLATIIEYYLMDSAAGRWLVRRERHADARTNNASRVELVCRGVERFACSTVVVDEAAANGPPAGGTLVAIPDRFPIQLYAPGSTEPFFDRTFDIR